VRTALLLSTILLPACEAFPRVDPSVEDVPGSVVQGTVMVGDDVAAPAPTILLMSAADDPMPPRGTGSPVTFATVNAGDFGPAGEGVLGAPFAFTGVTPGDWLILGLMDVDRSFHPAVSALATPTCGDLSGWNLGVTPDASAGITVDEQVRLQGIVVGPLRRIDGPQPIASVSGSAALVPNESVRLIAVGVHAAFGDSLRLDVPDPGQAGEDGCEAGFRFERVDADGNGSADASALLPLVEDRWPRAIFQWMGTPIDTDDDGEPDDFDRGDVGDDVTIAAIGDPAPTHDLPAPGVQVDLSELDVRFTGFGQRIDPDGTSTILAGGDLPAGAWSLTLVSRQGQIFMLPNELDDTLAMSRALPPPGLTEGSDRRMGVWFTTGE
jgi:hypothetical protein